MFKSPSENPLSEVASAVIPVDASAVARLAWVSYDAHLEGRQGADPSLASFALRLLAFPAKAVNSDSTKELPISNTIPKAK